MHEILILFIAQKLPLDFDHKLCCKMSSESNDEFHPQIILFFEGDTLRDVRSDIIKWQQTNKLHFSSLQFLTSQQSTMAGFFTVRFHAVAIVNPLPVTVAKNRYDSTSW